MNIVVITSRHHYYADLVLRRVCEQYGNQVVLVLEQDTIVPGRSKFEGIYRYYRQSGLFYLVNQIAKQLLIEATHRFYKPTAPTLRWEVLAKQGRVADTIAEAKPDVILSILSKYYLSAKYLRLAQLGCLNLHPALLPAYQGVSPIFWALARGETMTGATVHGMTHIIDQGTIYAQTTVPILTTDTEHSLYVRCALAGSELIPEAIERLAHHQALSAPEGVQPSAFSLPTTQAIRQFREHGRRFFSTNDLRTLYFSKNATKG